MLFNKDELIQQILDALKENKLPTSIYEENIKTLDFKDLNLYDKNRIKDIEDLNAAYIPATNTIAYKPDNNHLLRTLRHELVHVASTKRPTFIRDVEDIEVQFFHNFPFIPRSGISAFTYGNKSFGTSINEGITEFIRQYLVSEENEEFLLHLSYTRMFQFVGFLMILIGPDKLFSIYLNNDCMGFYEEMYKLFGDNYIKVILECDKFFNVCRDLLNKNRLSNQIIRLHEIKMNLTFLDALYSNNRNKELDDLILSGYYDYYYQALPQERKLMNNKMKKLSKKYNVNPLS